MRNNRVSRSYRWSDIGKMMNSFVKSSDFTKNTITLIVGTVLAQSIPFLLHPFLRRLYSPETFGAISVYLSLLAIISIISSLRYEAAIILPKEDAEAANMFSLTVFINLFIALTGFTFVLFFRDKICAWINFPVKYSSYLLLLPFAALAFSCYQSMNYWLIRMKAFKASTENKVVRRGVEGGVQLSLGLLHFPGGLFIGDLSGSVANTIAGWRQIGKNAYSRKWISVRGIKDVAIKYKDFPLFNLVPTLLSSLASTLPFLLINKFYSTEIVGYLDLTRLILSIPVVFISATISQVLFQQITIKKHALQTIIPDLRNVFLLLIVIIVLELVVILPFGPAIFSFLFGVNYAISGFYARILILSFSLNFIASTFSFIYISLNKIKLNAFLQILYFAGIFCLTLFRGIDVLRFLKVFVLIDSLFHIINIIAIYFIIRQYERQISSSYVSK